MNIVLASGSPRRREILQNLGLTFEVVSADVDESSKLTSPPDLVRELAERKAKAVAEKMQKQERETAAVPVPVRDLAHTLIIAADTVVSVDNVILGKPRDRQDAARMLRLLSGRTHEVYSGLCVILNGRVETVSEKTQVTFAPMTEEEISHYVATGEPDDKAGAYAIQGLCAAYIQGIQGCYFNVMGLPVYRLCHVCKQSFGVDLLNDGF